jgi:hypothetical protein
MFGNKLAGAGISVSSLYLPGVHLPTSLAWLLLCLQVFPTLFLLFDDFIKVGCGFFLKNN